MALWPLVRKQLHQTRAMKAIQPEIKKVKDDLEDFTGSVSRGPKL